MTSMALAAVSAALAVYVALRAARGVRASIPAPVPGERAMMRNERRDGRWICAFVVAFSLFLAAFACYVALVPGAAGALGAESGGTRLVVLTAISVVVTVFCLRETTEISRSADVYSDLYRMREVPLVYSALLWSCLMLGYAEALA